ncbi:undecaprenyl-diphosphatase UppP [Chloroflexi bacterium TSY]|nr:undecaprenyl-diphosphatase UppP [Chloroflexi bacterium TSY]
MILGFIQGATEFIPVSSSGHLVIVPWLLGWEPSNLLFDVVVHWGTLIAILFVFGRDFVEMVEAVFRSIAQRSLADPNARLAWFIVIGSIPAAIAGLLVKDLFEELVTASSAPLIAGYALLATALLLASSEFLTKRAKQTDDLSHLTLLSTLVIGLAQVLALLPGVSRSGSTIASGLIVGLHRNTAARFSFLLGAPVFLGAGLLQLGDALAEDVNDVIRQAPVLITGFLVSAVTGYAAIRFLLSYLQQNNLYPFAVYCLLAGCAVIGLYFA